MRGDPEAVMERKSRKTSRWVLLPMLLGILLVGQPHTTSAQSVAEQGGSPANSPVQPPNVFVVSGTPPPPSPPPPRVQPPPPGSSPPPPGVLLVSSLPPATPRPPPPASTSGTPGLVVLSGPSVATVVASPPPSSRSPPPPTGTTIGSSTPGLTPGTLTAASPPPPGADATATPGAPPPQQSPPPSQPAPVPMPPEPPPPSPPSPTSTAAESTGSPPPPPPSQPATRGERPPPPAAPALQGAGFAPGVVSGVSPPPPGTARSPPPAQPTTPSNSTQAASQAASPSASPGVISTPGVVSPPAKAPAASQNSTGSRNARPAPAPAATIAGSPPPPRVSPPPPPPPPRVVSTPPPTASVLRTAAPPVRAAAAPVPSQQDQEAAAAPVPSPAVAASVLLPTAAAPVPSPEDAVAAPVPSPQELIAAPLTSLLMPAEVPAPSPAQPESTTPAARPSQEGGAAPAPAPVVSSGKTAGITQLPIQQRAPTATPALSPIPLFAAPVRARAIDGQGAPVQSYSLAAPSPVLLAGSRSAPSQAPEGVMTSLEEAPAPVPEAVVPTNVQSLIDRRAGTGPAKAPSPGAASTPRVAPVPSVSPAAVPVFQLPKAPVPAPHSRAPGPAPRVLPVLGPAPAPHEAPSPAPAFAPESLPVSAFSTPSGPLTSLTPFSAPVSSPLLLGVPAPELVEEIIPYAYGPNLAPAPGVPPFLVNATQITQSLFYTTNNLGFYTVTQNSDGSTAVTPAFSTLPPGANSTDYTNVNVAFQFLGPDIFPFNASAQAALLSVLNDSFATAQIAHQLAVTAITPNPGSSGAPTGAATVQAPSPQGRRLLQTISATLEVQTANNVLVNVTVTVPSADQYNVKQLAQDAINTKEFRDDLAAAGYQLSTAQVVAVYNIATGNDVSQAPAPPSNTAVATTPKSSSTSVGVIAGAVGGGVAAVVAVFAALYCVSTRKRRQRAALEEEARRCKMSDADSDSPYGKDANGRTYEGPDGRAQVFANGSQKTNGFDRYPNGAGVYNSNDSSSEMGPISEDGIPRPHRLKASKGAMGSQEINLLGAPSSQGSPMSAMAHSIEPNGISSGGSNLERDPHLAMLKNQPDSFRTDAHNSMMSRINGSSSNLDPETARSGSSRIDANLWQVAWRDMTMQRQIGEGSFGKVYLAKWRETTVAVKVLTGGNIQDDDAALASIPSHVMKSLEKEASMMAAMRHPNVVMYLGVCLEPPAVLTEFCARGSLNDVLKKALTKPDLASQLDWPKRLGMALDAAKGMNYLHSSDPPVIHRDLKSPNLLVDKHWRVKVCDFNLSRVMEETAVLSSMAASNPRWLAPEILSGRGYTFSSDIYSFGIILWEFMTWRVPWHECGPWQVVALVTEHGHRPDIPSQEEMAGMMGSTFPGYDEYVELVNQCWSQDAEARPNFNDIIKVLRRLLAKELNARKSLQRRGSLSSQGSVPPDLRSDIMRSGATEEIVEVAHSSATNSHEKSSTTNSHEKSSGEETS